jgi:hypothetical protein
MKKMDHPQGRQGDKPYSKPEVKKEKRLREITAQIPTSNVPDAN